MFLHIIDSLNWIDLFFIIIIFRICYTAVKSGLIIEFFKLLGLAAALYLSLHYYTAFSDFINLRYPGQRMPLEFLDFFSFIFLSALGYLALVSVRSAITRFIKMEAMESLSKIGGLVFGIIRSALVVSLVSFLLTISSVNYLRDSLRNSYMGPRLFKAAPYAYDLFWESFFSKFVTKGAPNPSVNEVEEAFYNK